MNPKNRYILTNLLVSEFLLLNAVLVLFIYLIPDINLLVDRTFVLNAFSVVLIHNLCWLFIVIFVRENEFYFDKDHNYFKTALTSLFFFIGLTVTLVLLFGLQYFHLSVYIYPIVVFSLLNFISHKYFLKYLKHKGTHLFSNTLLISSDEELEKLNNLANTMKQYGYNLIGYLNNGDLRPNTIFDLKIFGKLDDLIRVLNAYLIDEIFIDMSALKGSQIKEAIKIADNYGVRVRLIPENPLRLANSYQAETIGGMAVFKLRQSPLDNFNKLVVKRLFDFCFALLVIVVLAPVYLLIALLIKLNSRGPVFYAPYRKGERGKTFRCYKFRTMTVCDNPVTGTKSTVVNDPRITKIGKVLRKLDLDELPQFFNVLKGEMSVIGPRPHRINLQNDFRKTVNEYMVRSYIRPGITGWAQVNGWRGPTDTEEQKRERVNHDLWYIENWSIWLDVKIMFLTLFGRHRAKAF